MKIGGIESIESISKEFYYSQGKTEGRKEDSIPEWTWETGRETEQKLPGDNMSLEEKYRVHASDREQKMQGLGLDYVDATRCTWEEFRSLCGQILDKTEYDAVPLEEVGITVEDETVEMDCLNYLREWSERESEKGNMVGYHMGKRLSGAIANYSADMQGEKREMVVNGETVKWSYMEDGEYYLSSGPNLGFNFIFGGGTFGFFAQYADDSTTENPIVKIQVSSGDNSTIIREYRVVLSEVNPKNATQMEMYALLSHQDKQGIGMNNPYGDNSYGLGMDLGIFDNGVSLEEFVNKKKDWVQVYEDKIKEIDTLLETSSLSDGKKKYRIGNFEMTRKEWGELLDILEEYWGKVKERLEEERIDERKEDLDTKENEE